MPEWIAERELASGVSEETVFARVSRPVVSPTGEWVCSVQVTGIERLEVTQAFGEDSLQALILGISMLRARVLSLQKRHKLTWLGGEDLALELEPRAGR